MGCLKSPSAGPYPRAVFHAGSPTFPCPQASATLHHPIFWPYQSPCGHFGQIFKKKGENPFSGPVPTKPCGYNPLGCPRKDAGARKGLAEHLLGWRTSVTTVSNTEGLTLALSLPLALLDSPPSSQPQLSPLPSFYQGSCEFCRLAPL